MKRVKVKAKIKYSNKYHAIMKRIRMLPKYSVSLMLSPLKKYALTCVKNFHAGIKKNSLGLEKLKDGTIRRKKYLGMERPTTPLYGKGDERKKDSYINMLRIRTIGKNGYRVAPMSGDHYSGLKMKTMFHVHEYGTLIKRGKGKKAVLIRIPPRPALMKAYNKTLIDRKVQDDSKKVKSAITKYVKNAELTALTQTAKQMVAGLKKYEIID